MSKVNFLSIHSECNEGLCDGEYQTSDCYQNNGIDYTGEVKEPISERHTYYSGLLGQDTKTKHTCQRWSDTHHPYFKAEIYPTLEGNKCRNPGGFRGAPWCFINKPPTLTKCQTGCLAACDNKYGPCPQFCGQNGLCCSLADETSCPAEALRALRQSANQNASTAQCVISHDGYEIDAGLADCWHKCGRKGGSCSFCGAGGFCCSDFGGSQNGDCPFDAFKAVKEQAPRSRHGSYHVCVGLKRRFFVRQNHKLDECKEIHWAYCNILNYNSNQPLLLKLSSHPLNCRPAEQ